MAAATITKRAVMSLGGRIKMEWIKTDDSVGDGDTVISQMNTPLFAMPFAVSDDSGDVSCAINTASTDEATRRTIVIHDPSTSGEILILAFGR